MADDQLLASAIVFPELLRYSKLRDIIETEALKTLYVQYGTQYANFSIGPFQMKPSFAEDLEKEWLKSSTYSTYGFDTVQCQSARLNRVNRLSKPDGQMLYLFLFIKTLNTHCANWQFETEIDKLRYFALVYQSGIKPINNNKKYILNKDYYHTDIIPMQTTQYFNYAEIVIFYYKNQNQIVYTN
jgi:hypothetical protein